MKQATLCFLVRENKGKIYEVCLAMKKRGFGMGRWNGVGGKVENESIEEAAAREAKEEINVEVKDIYKGNLFIDATRGIVQLPEVIEMIRLSTLMRTLEFAGSCKIRSTNDNPTI